MKGKVGVGIPPGPEDRELKPLKVERREEPPPLLAHEQRDLDVVVAVDADDVLGGALNQTVDGADQEQDDRALPAAKAAPQGGEPGLGGWRGSGGPIVAGREDRRRGDLNGLTGSEHQGDGPVVEVGRSVPPPVPRTPLLGLSRFWPLVVLVAALTVRVWRIYRQLPAALYFDELNYVAWCGVANDDANATVTD